MTPSYDRPYKRWLPVASEQVLPDGSAYAYTRFGGQGSTRNEIHVVDVATAVDTMIFDQGPYVALDYEPEGIYLTGTLTIYGPMSTGLSLLNPITRSLKAFPAAGGVSEVAGGVAWSSIWDSGRQFVGLDLATGVITVWFDVSNTWPPNGHEDKLVVLIGFDNSFHPLVEVTVSPANSDSELWLLTGPGQATRLSGPVPSVPDLPVTSTSLGITDSHGTWLGGTGGVYLFTGTGPAGPQRVADPPEAPLSVNAQYIIAGDCA